MDYNPGKELLNTFEELGIDLGNCGPNVIEAWFDTDCLEIKEFLNWISNNLNEQNVIQANEIEEYEENKRKKLIPSAIQYEIALNEVSEKYPGIFDIEENEFEIEFMEEELNILLEDNKKLNNILSLHKSLHEKEKFSLIQLDTQKINSSIDLNKAGEECFNNGCKLDVINRKLCNQLRRCSAKLFDYEYPSTATHISNVPLNKYNSQHKDILSYFRLLDKNEFASLPNLQSAVKNCSKLDGSIFRDKAGDEKIKKFKHKLFKSIQNRNCNEAMKDQLLAELKFLDQFSIYEVMNSLRTKEQLEINVQSISDHYAILALELENLALEESEKYIEIPSICITKKEANLLQNKLNNISKVDSIFTSIFSYHTLLYSMIMINNADILMSDQVFRSIHHYIAHNLTKCQLRMESMETIIRQYKLYNEIPFQERNTLLKILLRLLSVDDANAKLDVDMLNNLKKVEYHFGHIDESLQFRENFRMIEANNKLLRSFLTSGPTSEFVTFPFKLHDTFKQLDNILNIQNNVVTTSVEIWKSATKQVTQDAWFKYKKQLWMYFLKHPQKVLANIEKIKAEVENIRIENM